MTSQETFNTMYHWIGTLNRAAFQTYVMNALARYVPTINLIFSNKNRASEVRCYFHNDILNNQQIFARIFSQGQISASSLNGILFKGLLNIMQNDLNFNQMLHINTDNDDYLYNLLNIFQSLAKNATYEDPIQNINVANVNG